MFRDRLCSFVTDVIILDLGGARFRLEQGEIKRRDRVFWHLFSSDVWAVSFKFYSCIRRQKVSACKFRVSRPVDHQVHHWALLIAIFPMIMKRWAMTVKGSWAVSSDNLLQGILRIVAQTSVGTTSLSSCYLRSWLPHSPHGRLHMQPSLILTGS